MNWCRRIGAIAAAAAVMLSCGRQGRVIPAGKMSEIYADMLVADQRIRNNPELMQAADTSLFYEPVFARYGYSGRDYVRSVNHYMEDPESFKKIFAKTKEIIDGHVAELRAVEKAAKRADSLRTLRASMPYLVPVYQDSIWSDAWYTMRPDTVRIDVDSMGICSWMRFPLDTLFDGPAFRLREVKDTSAAVADTVSADLAEVRSPALKPAARVSEKIAPRQSDEARLFRKTEIFRKK